MSDFELPQVKHLQTATIEELLTELKARCAVCVVAFIPTGGSDSDIKGMASGGTLLSYSVAEWLARQRMLACDDLVESED